MKSIRINPQGLIKYLPFLFLVIAVLLPSSESPAGQVVEVVVEDPELSPPFTTCPESYWYPFDNDRGHTAYLTLNAFTPANSTNDAEWRPVIPQPGYYLVEAYISAHSAITWCTGQGRTINHDTTEAHYSIHHATGVTMRSFSQYPLSNQWLNLGEYYFNADDSGFVYLTDLNGEDRIQHDHLLQCHALYLHTLGPPKCLPTDCPLHRPVRATPTQCRGDPGTRFRCLPSTGGLRNANLVEPKPLPFLCPLYRRNSAFTVGVPSLILPG